MHNMHNMQDIADAILIVHGIRSDEVQCMPENDFSA